MKNPYFNLIGAIWQYGARHRPALVMCYIAFVLAQLAIGIAPYAIGRAIDVLQHFKPQRLTELLLWLSADIGITLTFWLFHGPARVIERRIALNIQQTFRLNLYKDLTHLPLKWHQEKHSGNLITRFNRAANALRNFGENQFVYIESIVQFTVSMGFMLWISWAVGLISLITTLLVVTAVLLFDRKLIPMYETENEMDNRVGAVLFDYISNITTILTLRLGKLTLANLFQRLMVIWPVFKKETVLNEKKWFILMMLLFSAQSLILIAYVLYELHVYHTILIGLVVMLFRYQQDLTHVFFDLSVRYSDLVRMDADLRGVSGVLTDIHALAHTPSGENIAKKWHEIEITDLCFHQSNQQHPKTILDNLAFKIRRGEKIALIGESGGGKTTLLNLLSGLYDPDKVQLNIDGIYFSSLEPLQTITTLIPQEPELFENTIAFNITLDLPAQDATLTQVIELAGFTPVLKQLPDGLKTDIRERGLNLSVGQKQRLALARGLFAAHYVPTVLHTPSMNDNNGDENLHEACNLNNESYSSLVLMDEPTSSVDLATEKKILSGIIRTFPDTALIISLHRLHLLPHFDSVIFLEAGRILASGSVKTLLNQPGPVYDLWQRYQKLD